MFCAALTRRQKQSGVIQTSYPSIQELQESRITPRLNNHTNQRRSRHRRGRVGALRGRHRATT
eukprot:4382866-Prymnesium_polylepis.1